MQFQSQSLADMHLQSLQREQEMRFRKNIPKNFSATSFTPMQSEGFKNSKWAAFFRPTGYKPMIVLFFFFLIQQFSGIYITLFYAVTFFQVSSTRYHHTSFHFTLKFQTVLKPFELEHTYNSGDVFSHRRLEATLMHTKYRFLSA